MSCMFASDAPHMHFVTLTIRKVFEKLAGTVQGVWAFDDQTDRGECLGKVT